MGYINKITSPLINTKITDAGRMKIAQGDFNIKYFQVGDSELCYNDTNFQNFTDTMILSAEDNYQNLVPFEVNKTSVKYPIRLDENNDNSFGVTFSDTKVESVHNRPFVAGAGLFDENGKIITETGKVKNPNFLVKNTELDGGRVIGLTDDIINSDITDEIKVDDILVIIYGTESTYFNQNYPMLVYKVTDVKVNTVTLDRNVPNFSGEPGYSRVIIYPSGMIGLYDYPTPESYWNQNTVMFESFCTDPLEYTTVWNLNIPWSESPAGTSASNGDFGSKEYLGTKELLGYNTNSGQIDNSETYYYNSLNEKIIVLPDEQKSIAILHYSNNTISNVYGEKFSMEPYVSGEIGEARNFKITIPWLMWHKSDTIGQEFYVDPPNNNLLTPYYIESSVNNNLNEPGLRYYHLWDNNETPNRVGKVWPDLKIVTFDDEEIVAVLTNNANRSFTLPAPKIGLIPPNNFDGSTSSDNGILETEQDTLWVTYRLEHTNHTYMHCNYYQSISGTDENCLPETANVVVNFGNEFSFLTNSGIDGFSADKIYMLAQKVTTGERPNPSQWRQIEVTNQISSGTVDGTTISTTTFQITKNDYESAQIYNLGNLIGGNFDLNFGDEYIFFGMIETDIQATIYVANFLCNLSSTQYLKSTNPTWDDSKDVYVSEIGLYDDEKDLMIISKLQSPQRRIGVQQYSIKIDI